MEKRKVARDRKRRFPNRCHLATCPSSCNTSLPLGDGRDHRSGRSGNRVLSLSAAAISPMSILAAPTEVKKAPGNRGEDWDVELGRDFRRATEGRIEVLLHEYRHDCNCAREESAKQ